MNSLYCLFILRLIFCSFCLQATPYVVPVMTGQLGNQLFQIAAATSLALEHHAKVTVPDLKKLTTLGIPENRRFVLWRLETVEPKVPLHSFTEASFAYAPIPYQPNMQLKGFFQSEKYFEKHKEEIIQLFAPLESIETDLKNRYPDVVYHPCSVAIHIRTYADSDPQHRYYYLNGRSYVEKALSFFPESAYCLVFSDNMEWCKKELAEIRPNLHFIEGESYIHDFYLMSFCKHNIISNSTFSWWAAYLNSNPYKIVIAPKKWFTPKVGHDTRDLIPDNWFTCDD
ncbi:alpha-1,2-fucosyltransferase [Parachlamydia sp. AcF125]|uniref:alpha-1,2-fucosyltransferase n=1 Tax=Parachlamydia sp. AcF125 TaxID=2795736 RepID=UPI001BC91B3B|nr:alpha-1,2-fucosyltransferase [Parachlamydia sp. AcF125]MBS4168468.1 O-antigen biosynthesis glycosyltransferase WbnK [Parachlamydia sp. AcF125]